MSDPKPCEGRPKASKAPKVLEEPGAPPEDDTQPREAGVRMGDDTGEKPPPVADDGVNELKAFSDLPGIDDGWAPGVVEPMAPEFCGRTSLAL